MRGRKLQLSIIILSAAVLFIAASACSAAADEFRGFWVDAWGDGLKNQAQVDKLLGVVGDPDSKGDIRNANCNAVIVQVRRRADVCYPSAMGEPYFSGLSPSTYNALQAIINAAHDTTGGKQRIEVHCWIVTFATSTATSTPAPLYYQHNNPADPDNYWVTLSDTGVETDDKALDPGHPKCEEYLVNVCMDLVTNFDIDGIHYDYVRFTANNQGYNPTSIARFKSRYGYSTTPVPTDETFKQWRRDQVSALVRKVYAKIQAVKPQVKQSGSFVTWNPSPTSSTRTGFQDTRPYYDVYSDWDSWMQEGIVDFAVPMTYYNWSVYPNDYTRWINFEKDRKANRHMVIGPGIYLNSLQNAINELLMTRSASPAGNYAQGFCGYSYRVPYNGGTWDTFAPQLVAQVTPTPANIPVMPWKVNPTKGHISGAVTYAASGAWADGATVSISGPENRAMLCDGTGFYAFIDLTPGTYTVTASKTGYPNIQKSVTVTIGQVTGNMYVTNFSLGGQNPPAITNVNAGNITTNSAVISWNTDQPSSSKVEYGLTASYGSSTVVDNTQVTSHSMTISGLTQNTLYHYRVISTGTYGTTTSTDYTFTTSGPPSISNVQSSNVTSTTATITWTTNAPTNGTVNYGATISYGSQASDTSTSAAHTVNLSGLTPNTTYHYQCVSSNSYGTAQSIDYTFTTLQLASEYVIDNTDAGWSNTSPNGNGWTSGSAAGVPRIGSNYLIYRGDGSTTESSITRKCRWTPDLPVSGYYDVYVYYQIGANRNSAAPYKVYYNGGSVTSIQNQYSSTPNQGGWFLVGSNLPFTAGSSGYVELTTLTTDVNYVSADAAKWVYKSAIDVTAPVMAAVTDEKYTTSTTTLNASWSASDPESGIQRYDYAVGSQTGGTDIKNWTSAGTATSASIAGLSLNVGSTYYISVRALNGVNQASTVQSSSGVTIARSVSSTANAKSFPNGTVVALPPSGVTATFSGFFYVEDGSRASGIRIVTADSQPVGKNVRVYGKLTTVNGAERALTDCKVVIESGIVGIGPLMMSMPVIGGSDLNAYSPGIFNGIGLNNIGLLIKTAGKVTALLSDGFYLDDGSRIQDESVNSGIKILQAIPTVTLNSTVSVTGIVSCRTSLTGEVYPVILAREIRQF